MEIKYFTAYRGLDTLHSPRQVADDYVIDCRNVLFRDGTVRRRYGLNPTLEQLPITTSPPRHIIYYNQFFETQKSTVVVTEKDIWVYDLQNKKWDVRTPIYTTGTVSVNDGENTVTGTSTLWLTNNIDDGNGSYEIKFNTQDPNDLTKTWYVITTVSGEGSLTIGTNYSGSSLTGVQYCIRKCLYGGNSDWTIATDSVGTRGLFIVDGYRVIQLGDPDNQAVDVSGANPAYYCGFYGSASGQHLVLGNTTDTGVRQPMTLEMSDIGQPTQFTEGYYIDLYDSNDEIVGMRKIRDYIAVYKRHSITLLYPAYTTDLFTTKENVVNGVGAVNNSVIADCNNFHIFMGETNVYIFDGVNLAPIGDSIKRTLFNNINWDFIHHAHAFYDSVHDLYMLFVPRIGEEYPKICYVYDVITQAWTIFEYNYIITSSQETYIPYSFSWADMSQEYTDSGGTQYTYTWLITNKMTWAQMQGGATKKQIIFCTHDCRFLYFDEDAQTDYEYPIRAYMVTKDYPLNEPYQLATMGDMRFYLGAIDVNMYGITTYVPHLIIKGSMNYGYEYSQEYLVDTSGNDGEIIDRTVGFALRGTHFRAFISNSQNGDPFVIEGFALVYNDAGV